ncbi:MAG: methyltransferase domain-containing protein [Gammaproteobacteria bacterium]|nr:methyltransferase domain-containing protein [Gammaproteobacteria bacterium]
MAEQPIQFNDGAAYERMMGRWSRLAGDVFLDWLAVESGLRWVDVGCGNGAFTEAVIERCAPSAIEGVDPSQGQLEFARTRDGVSLARFHQGDAMSLPQEDNSFDVAAMALVLFFVPDPVKGLAEMRRVVTPGGVVSAYAWDILGGGFPLHAFQEELRAMGLTPPLPPSVEASRLKAMEELWVSAGLVDVEVREITVERTFTDFDDLWGTSLLGPSVGPMIASMGHSDANGLKQRLEAQFPVQNDGRITYSARANAVKGRVRA